MMQESVEDILKVKTLDDFRTLFLKVYSQALKLFYPIDSTVVPTRKENFDYCKFQAKNLEDYIRCGEISFTLALPILSLLKGKDIILLAGPPGSGKTYLAEVLPSIVYSSPGNLVRAVMQNGNQEVTIENIIGLLDLGALSNGETRLIPNLRIPFAYLFLIVDEFNRLGPSAQNFLLELLDTNDPIINFYNVTVIFPERLTTILTGNPWDTNIQGVSQALVDRISYALLLPNIVIPYKYMDYIEEISLKTLHRRDELINFINKINSLLKKNSIDDIVNRIDEFRQKYAKNMRSNGIFTLYPEELNSARKFLRSELKKISVPPILEYISHVLNDVRKNSLNPFVSQVATARFQMALRDVYSYFQLINNMFDYDIPTGDILKAALPITLFPKTLHYNIDPRRFSKFSEKTNIRNSSQTQHILIYFFLKEISQVIINAAMEMKNSNRTPPDQELANSLFWGR